jgi:hypothetical protein
MKFSPNQFTGSRVTELIPDAQAWAWAGMTYPNHVTHSDAPDESERTSDA